MGGFKLKIQSFYNYLNGLTNRLPRRLRCTPAAGAPLPDGKVRDALPDAAGGWGS